MNRRQRDPYPTQWSYTKQFEPGAFRPLIVNPDPVRAKRIIDKFNEIAFVQTPMTDLQVIVDSNHRFKINSTRLVCFGWYEPRAVPPAIKIRDFCLVPQFPEFALEGTIYMAMLDRLWHCSNPNMPWPFHGTDWYMAQMRNFPDLIKFMNFRKNFHEWASNAYPAMEQAPLSRR